MLLNGIGALALLISVLYHLRVEAGLLATVGVFAGTWLTLAALAFAFLWVICARVDTEKVQEEDSPFYREMMTVYIEALVTLVRARIHTRGVENIPAQGRFLLVCNHLFLADPGVLLNTFRSSQLAFISKQENLQMPIVGKFLHKTLGQTLPRDNDRAALLTIRKCTQLIREDQASVAVFPEGYTSKDGKLHPFRPGVFRIAQKAEVPIVVCTVQGTREIFKNLKKGKSTDIELHLVEVIPAEAIRGLTTVQISDMVYEKMLGDLGEHWRMPVDPT